MKTADVESKAVENKKNRSRLIAVVRVVFAAVALGFVLYSVDYKDYLVQGKQKFQILRVAENHYVVRDKSGSEFTVLRGDKNYQRRAGAVSLVKNAKVAPTIFGLAIFTAVPLILAYRWRILLKVQGVDLPYRNSLQLTYAGHFLNFFLIGTTGGDFVKAYWLGKFSPKRAEGFVSVFVDRFIGLVVLILMAAGLVVVMWHDSQVAKLGRAVGILVVLTAGAVVFLFSRHLRTLLRFDRWKEKLPIHRLIDRVDQSLLAYRKAGGILLQAALATLILQFISSTASYFLGSALQIKAQIWYYWLYVPLAFLIGSIPVSVFWGLGLLEGAYVSFFWGSGFATVTQAAMLAMAVRLMQLFWSLPGSLILAAGIGNKDSLATNNTNEHELGIESKKV